MWILGKRKARRLAELDLFRQVRRLAEEDVTVFGEQLSALHLETLTSGLDGELGEDYQRALDAYELAKARLHAAETTQDVTTVNTTLDDGRFARACVLARRDGVALPQRREPCFFNPQHGPAATDKAWTPRGGVERLIPVCGSDARRMEQGAAPEVRQVRVGDRWVPWHEAEAQRGVLVVAMSVRRQAMAGVPKYVMLEADINRAGNNINAGQGGFGI